ncbi:MAG: NUDIX domain-containing protein [Caulobacterales bacterium]
MNDSIPALPAATVLLVRQRAEMEVLMVGRNATSYFPSALVFPGGIVDEEDGSDYWAEWGHGGDDLEKRERAFRVAAFRELYEETGILLVDDAPAGAAPASPAPGADRFIDVLRKHHGRLDLAAMHPFAHWITPEFAPKRFDTHFFLCGIETEVVAISDGDETVSVEWISPRKALELAETKDRHILFPTKMNLRMLAYSNTVEEALIAVKTRKIVAVTPRLEERADGRYLVIPSDAGYGVAEDRPPAPPPRS